jgi:putative oxidoreductase
MLTSTMFHYLSWAILLLRITVGIVFLSSGWSHVSKPSERSKSIGMSKTFTQFLGTAELAGAVGIMLGILTQIAAAILIVVMAGAIWKKIFVWKVGFYADKGYGWHYDLILLSASLVIFLADGGKLVLM